VRPRAFLKQLGDEVRARREGRDLSQEALAHAAGVNTNTLRRLELAINECQVLTILNVSMALSTPLSELIAAAERRG
jgi:transcriptional regulator with XRE-family HTH domain